MTVRTYRQYNSYNHTQDFVEEISPKLLYYPELFINHSVIFIVYFCMYFGYFICMYCGLNFLARTIMYPG